jgi:hypothetical protein
MITTSFFRYCIDNNYSPNELFMLYCIKKAITKKPSSINESLQIRNLVTNGLILANGSITDKGNEVLKKILAIAEPKKEQVLVSLEFAKNYLSVFPKGILPSGVPSRMPIKQIQKDLSWFLSTYSEYTEDIVMRAASYYVENFARNDYAYMKNSKYFIAKTQPNKIIYSTLAEYCQLIVEGIDDVDDIPEFKTRVV